MAVDRASPIGPTIPSVEPSAPRPALVDATPSTPALPAPAFRRYAQANTTGGPLRVAPLEPEAERAPGFDAQTLLPNLIRVLQRVYPPLDFQRFPEVATGSLQGIAALDSSLSVEREGNRLYLMRGNRDLASFAVPANAGQWASAAERVVEVFSPESRAVAEAGPAALTDAFFRGLAESLGEGASYRPSTESPSVAARATDGQVNAEIIDGVGVLRVPNVSVYSALVVRDNLEAWGLLGDGPPQVSGLVIDLTHALGEELGAASIMADDLLRRGVVYRPHGNDPSHNKPVEATSGGIPENIPIVVLTNGATRGGAEVLAQALQENRRAVIHGTSSLGETHDTDRMLVHGGGELSFTSGRVFGPAGVTANGQGVTPQSCAAPGGTALTPRARSDARRLGQDQERPTIPLRRFCPPSPSRAIVTGSHFQPFDNPDGDAWTRDAVALARDPARYRALLDQVELAPQPAVVRARNIPDDLPQSAGPR